MCVTVYLLTILTDQSDISEVLAQPQLREGGLKISLELGPLQSETVW